MQSAHFDVLVDVLLKCPRRDAYRGVPSNITTSDSNVPHETLPIPRPAAHWARGIIDISQIKLGDVPLAIEERLRKSKGMFSVQVNAFSKKLAVEFDPLVISLEEIKKTVIHPAETDAH
jgi:hypothetical protein